MVCYTSCFVILFERCLHPLTKKQNVSVGVVSSVQYHRDKVASDINAATTCQFSVFMFVVGTFFSPSPVCWCSVNADWQSVKSTC